MTLVLLDSYTPFDLKLYMRCSRLFVDNCLVLNAKSTCGALVIGASAIDGNSCTII